MATRSLNPFISRTDLSNRLGVDLTADEKALDCVDAACDICRSATGQMINLVEGETVLLDGGTQTILLPELPIVEVVSVIEGDDLVTSPDNFVVYDNGVLRRVGVNWLRGQQMVEVTYTHGWAPDDLPRDLRIVALVIAERLFKQGPGVFEALGAYQVRYDSPTLDLTPGEKQILRKYRPTKQRWATVLTS